MKVVLLLPALIAFSLAQDRCVAPNFLTANISESYYDETRKELYHGFVRFYYDRTAMKTRKDVDFYYYISREDKARYSIISDYQQHVEYKLDLETRECTTVPMDKPFQPLEIPEEAYYRGRAIVGVEGSVGNVLNAAIWVGTISTKGVEGRYSGLWTDNCLPVLHFFRSENDWTHWDLFDVLTTVDPSVFQKPTECQ